MSVNLAIAAELCQRFEGFRSKPYLCPAGVATIGYGSTYYPGGRKVTLQDAPVSEAQAREILMHELFSTYLPGVARLCPVLVTLASRDPGKLNAIVDFAYNLGVGNLQISTLRRKINEQNWPAAREQLMRWTKAGGRELPGLVKRRKAEAVYL
jgi:lysozyme